MSEIEDNKEAKTKQQLVQRSDQGSNGASDQGQQGVGLRQQHMLESQQAHYQALLGEQGHTAFASDIEIDVQHRGPSGA